MIVYICWQGMVYLIQVFKSGLGIDQPNQCFLLKKAKEI